MSDDPNNSEWLICGTNSWEDLKTYLPEAKLAGILISVIVLPPYQSDPVCSEGSFSEPFGQDYILWAEEIATLSLRYSNLTEFGIYDLRENLTLGYLRESYIDSVIAAGQSINPRLQFISEDTTSNWYVGLTASGSANATSWVNKDDWATFNWAQVVNGDSVFIDGGPDSLTYPSVQLGTLGWIPATKRLSVFTQQVIVTKGQDAGHNGKVILQNTDASGNNFTLGLVAVSNMTFTGLTFNTAKTVDDAATQKEIVSMSGNNIIIDNCEIISNGLGTCIFGIGCTRMSITNNTIRVLHNNYESDADCIYFNSGAGGHTITGNIMTNGKIDNTYHADFIQYGEEGSNDRLLTTIANNIMVAPFTDCVLMAGINTNMGNSNRFLIYNNIIALQALGSTGMVFYNGANISSLRAFNNIIITKNWVPISIANMDTVILKNNILLSTTAHPSLYFSTAGGIDSVTYKDIDYNHYDRLGGTEIYTNSSTAVSFATWQGLGYDAHGSSGAVTFAELWGTDIVDYLTTTGRDAGVDLSSYFATDINLYLRPYNSLWDMGAIEYHP